MPEVHLRNVCKSYGSFNVCRDVCLEIHDSEFVTLLGASGCGKTTTLNMIAGLDNVTSGEILMNGENVNDREPVDRDVAMVFQNYALYPHMTVAENIGFNLKLRGVGKSEIAKRVQRTAQALDLARFLDRRPSQLSGGQQQRVAIGRAIVREPKVFLFDEPFSNLDADLRIRMRGEVRALHDRYKTTSVFVTHDQEEALSISDRIAVMRGGQVEQFDTPENVYSRPETAYVAQFIGHPTIEITSAEIRHTDGQLRLFAGEAEFALTDAQAHALGQSTGEISVAVRPEFVALGESGIRVVIDEVQPVGPSTVIRLKWNGGSMFARVNGIVRPVIGTTTHIRIDEGNFMFFDRKTMRRIQTERGKN
ncbi:ABC transporter ATP-binding protein [Rhizobium mongolense]|uniref:ABC-type sugar transport system ATPase subunit n=1 Tax=Rhizobium mongolense TaxID=57676 RepID=A0A7W6RSD0_9HYPH|nr:ATP-binding cassette domain-containing protein [Rhizobium mongolense]MBB4277724.1 ABC-type sugar transport system ATPase subunit [Rhizobium mongolense]